MVVFSKIQIEKQNLNLITEKNRQMAKKQIKDKAIEVARTIRENLKNLTI